MNNDYSYIGTTSQLEFSPKNTLQNNGKNSNQQISLFSGDRYRKSLQHEFKQKIQFSLKTNNSSLNGLFMKVYLVGTSVNNEEMLHFGINDKSELWIEVFNQRLLINKPIVPKTWHKIVITKQHHRLSFKLGHHFEVLQLDKSWPMISFSEKPIIFTGK